MKQLAMLWVLVTGPKDEDGKIRPARPAIIIGSIVVVLAVLTWVTDGLIWAFLVVAAMWGGIWASTRKDEAKAKRREQIREALVGSEVTSTYDIARRTGFDLREIESAIAEMITTASSGRKSPSESLRFLRNAKLDVVAHKVTLDPMATASMASKFGASANAVIDRFAPAREVAKPDWTCEYCRSANTGEATACGKCGAGRVA